MFEQRLWAWQFDKYETTGAASRFAHVNQERLEGKNMDLTMDEVTRVSPSPPSFTRESVNPLVGEVGVEYE